MLPITLEQADQHCINATILEHCHLHNSMTNDGKIFQVGQNEHTALTFNDIRHNNHLTIDILY